MNNLDFDYAAMTSGAVASLIGMTDQEGEPFAMGTPLFYLDPLAFDQHLEQTPPALWPREFRRSAAIIRETGERYAAFKFDGLPVADVMGACLVCLHSMAKDYAPEMAGELAPMEREPMEENETARNQDKRAVLFAALRAAGCLDTNDQPDGLSKTDVAYMAKEVGALIGVSQWAKRLAEPWGVYSKNASKLIDQKTSDKNGARPKIAQALAEAVRNNEILQHTPHGKEILKRSSMSIR